MNSKKKSFQKEGGNVGLSWYKINCLGKSQSLREPKWIPCTSIHYRKYCTHKLFFTEEEYEELSLAETWVGEVCHVVKIEEEKIFRT